MNRFRTKRRAKEEGSGASEQSSLPSFKGFRRGKKSSEEEPKKEFDLSSALPSDDNFRTSLLMTNLSARFSMLREQDDPNTKIGKASDDSVLFPKRQSRLGDFGFTSGVRGLSDIAEVESIKAPYLRDQVNSFVSDDADSSMGGSIMNRSKPTDGNVLFGGRQKIYKIPAHTNKSGMGGRALYDDDVSMSAFQLWRQTERQKQFLDDNEHNASADDREGEEIEAVATRSTSPVFTGYNKKRETSSTTSSASAMARNSTAATSITSQPATSGLVKDSPQPWTAPPSTSSTPVLERSVTRTRRLYEQALTQDMHDQQSSALSRMDTLSRQRPAGTRTPDLAQISPSPSSLGFYDRLGERRPILAKASAPNLRSFSPQSTGSSLSTLESNARLPRSLEKKGVFGGSPPISPPISETGEHPLLSIQPNDRGKATAMGVFQKPLEPYDESKYAQRQLQLQQGRSASPNKLDRTVSDASTIATSRSSSSSLQRQPFESRTETPIRLEPTVQEESANPGTFFEESDADDATSAGGSPSPGHAGTPQVVLERPSDQEHPALRDTVASVESLADPSMLATTSSRQGSPPDSPTLGPTAGLSGMVRQHLRSGSNVSSLYDQTTPLDEVHSNAHPWTAQGQQWAPEEEVQPTTAVAAAVHEDESDTRGRGSGDDTVESEPDEFASQLADARRRVRERLTSYAETDSSREPSPLRHSDPKKDIFGPLSPSSPLGGPLGLGILRPKSSRGSLIERSRTTPAPHSKAMKMLGIGSSTMTASPSPSKQSFDEKVGPGLARMEEEPSMASMNDGRRNISQENLDTGMERRESVSDKEDENAHPGLRAFRQARRELQRRKELDTLARHQASQGSLAGSRSGLESRSETGLEADQAVEAEPRPSRSAGDGRARQGSTARDQRPAAAPYQPRMRSDESRYDRSQRSHPDSRHTPTERSRSDSEASRGQGPPSSRPPPRPRNASSPYDGYQPPHNHRQQPQYQQQLGPNNPPRQNMLRSPGLPGTDIRRSPIMPPQGYAGSVSGPGPTMSSPHYLERARSAANLTVQPSRTGHEAHSGQPSPISPLSSPEGDWSLYGDAGTMQSAPPVPPLNPRRKREGSGSTSKDTRQYQDRKGDEDMHGASRPLLSESSRKQEANRSPAAMSDSEDMAMTDQKRGLRVPNGHGGMHPHSPGFRGPPSPWQRPSNPSPNQFVAAGPPASRTVLTPGVKPPSKVVPGGMF